MAGFLAALFGGPKTADPDPVPGIGGYDYPRGPAGQTGYPGSTSSTRYNPRLADKNRLKGLPTQTVEAQQLHRQDNPGEWHGGLPFGDAPSATYVGPQYQDTEKRSNPVISAGTPGGQNQRNTKFYGGIQARPGETQTYQVPPKGGRPATEVEVPSRYVFGGVNGGYESHSMDRRMPYTGHGTTGNLRSVRGAVLDGNRFTQAPPVLQAQGTGYGKARLRQRHRPTVFAEPAPWSANFYDTTEATGGPATPGTPATVQNVLVSPAPSRGNAKWRRGG